MQMDIKYDKKSLRRHLMILLATVILMKLSGGAGFAIVAIYALSAMMRRRDDLLFFSLLITLCMIMANGYFVPKNTVFFMIQRGMLAIVAMVTATHMCGQKSSKIIAPILGLLVYLFYMVIPSMTGWMPKISLLKLFLFTIIFIAFAGIVNELATSKRLYAATVRSMFLCMAIFFIFGSIAVIPFPAISLMGFDEIEKGRVMVSLFKGMTSHSQSLGPLIGGLMTLLVADLVFSIKKMDKLYLALIACCPYLIYKTSSRTAFGTALGGVLFVIYLFMHARNVNSRWRGKVVSSALMIGVFCSACVIAIPSTRNSLALFITKSTEESGVKEVNFENVTASRAGLVEKQMKNFKDSPAFGNGFQVSEEMKDLKIVDFRQLLSAPVEKGVWFSAVLEEGGAIGFGIFIIFIISALISLHRSRAYMGMSMIVVLLLSNMGEFSMFSMSAIGGFMWGLVFVGLALDSQRIKEESFNGRFPPCGYYR